MPLPQMGNQIRKKEKIPFFLFDCPSEEGAHSCLETSWEKSETKSSVNKEFLLFSLLNCLLSWDKNLINHDFHQRKLTRSQVYSS